MSPPPATSCEAAVAAAGSHLPLVVGVGVRLVMHEHQVAAHLLHVLHAAVGQLQQQLVGGHARHAVRAPATYTQQLTSRSQRDTLYVYLPLYVLVL